MLVKGKKLVMCTEYVRDHAFTMQVSKQNILREALFLFHEKHSVKLNKI